jgi:acyl carrier protein
MTQQHDRQQRLTNVFREVFDDPTLAIRDEHTPGDIAGWDSLTHVNLIVSVEEEFDIRLSTAEIASVKSVGDLAKFVRARAA